MSNEQNNELLPETPYFVNDLPGEVQPAPSVGLPATQCMMTDCHGATITRVCKNFVEFRLNKAVRMDNNGMSESQHWRFTSDLEGEPERAYLRKDGRYHGRGFSLLLGIRKKYYDYSF